MTSTNVKEIKYLGTFVEKAFKVRNESYELICNFLLIQVSVCVFSRSHQYIIYMFCKPLNFICFECMNINCMCLLYVCYS